MEGLQPVSQPPTPAPRLTPKRILLAFAVAAAVVVAGTAVFVLTRPPPIPLTLHDGSTTRPMFGNYTSIVPPDIFRGIVSATSTANQSQGATSSLTLVAIVVGWFEPNPNSTYAGTWHMEVTTIATGSFAPDLAPSSLALTANGTSADSRVASQTLFLGGTNVSYAPGEAASFVDTGSATVSATLVNRSASAPAYDFMFEDEWTVNEYLAYNGTYGFRATVTGDFTPSVTVEIRLVLVNVSTAVPPTSPPPSIAASISVSSNGADWVVTFTSVPTGLSNTTTDFLVNDYAGRSVVPATALGSLYMSPYSTNLSYIPFTAGASMLEAGDQILLSRTAYPAGDQVKIVTSSAILYDATLQ